MPSNRVGSSRTKAGGRKRHVLHGYQASFHHTQISAASEIITARNLKEAIAKALDMKPSDVSNLEPKLNTLTLVNVMPIGERSRK